MDPLELLLGTLEDLTAKDLKTFQLYLTEGALKGFDRIPKGKLEKCDPPDTAGIMREAYGSEGALRITLLILKKMKHNDLADKLEGELEKSGPGVSVDIDKGSESAIQQQLKAELKDKCACIFEGPEETKVQLDEVYTELHVTEGVSEEVNTQHEVLQIQTNQTQKDIIIKCNDIMKSPPGKKVRTVMTTGIAGIGKSVSVQKFCLDWAEERANQDIDFIFVLPFRELNLLQTEEYSLLSLLIYFHPELMDLNAVKMDKNSKILFIFDGLDESKLELNFRSEQRQHDLRQTSSVSQLLTNLIQGHLLQSSLIWITSRPAAVNLIPSRYVDKWTEIRGFNDTQKDEYFSRRFSNSHINKIISQIKTRRSLYIMCHIPVFCWILVCVLQDMLSPDSNMDIPKTMTELFIHFLLIQTNRKNQRCSGQSEPDRIKLMQRHKEHILRLSELAFRQLEKESIVFSKKDLRESGIEDSEIKEYSEVCTEIFKKDRTFYKRTFYCFVHLSVQEFLAALHVFYSFVNKNHKVLESFTVPSTSSQEEERPKEPHEDDVCQDGMSLHVLLTRAVDKSLESKNGHLDLFLRFLLGISLESNQELLEGLLLQVEDISASLETTTEYIKKILSEGSNSVERCLNLLLCLLEMKDSSLHENTKEYVKSGQQLTPAQCSLQAYILLMSEEVLDDFDLTMYRTSQEGRERLLIVLRSCRKARLNGCGLNENSCGVISANLQSESACLRELDLSSNPLCDAGVERLSVGLKHTYCTLETLRLADCELTSSACKALASVLQSDNSHLTKMDLKKLDLTNNDLTDSGVKELCAALGHRSCRLELLRLSGCLISQRGCGFIVSALTSNPDSHLTELDLSYNHPGDAGLQILSALPEGRVKMKVNIDNCSKRMLKKGKEKYACELTLDPNTAHRKLLLSEGNVRVTGVKGEQPYPDHPDRFEDYPQVLSREPLTGRCYWECWWFWGAGIGVAYKSIVRKGDGSGLGRNGRSWSLACSGSTSGSSYSAWGSNIKTALPAPPPDFRRIGVYLDREAGTLSFYSITSDALTHLHTFYTTFTDEPLYAGLVIFGPVSLVIINL
ncbi:NACHT, LRR and PYD domains-containing protein 12-like isoform X2 [Alosa pseudoharengus]|uniref:NACHT, LRR and PYD domains-containing protein 12-like isoform X2 n=1 Tax=Alosa pseudoharengus TaxID=34774 RepID=UPI003F8C2094